MNSLNMFKPELQLGNYMHKRFLSGIANSAIRDILYAWLSGFTDG